MPIKSFDLLPSTMCKYSKKAAQLHAKHGRTFTIERNIEGLHELAEELKIVREENGEIFRAEEGTEDAEVADRIAAEIDKTIRNYGKRLGLTNFPITWKNLCRNIPVLHAKLKVWFDMMYIHICITKHLWFWIIF